MIRNEEALLTITADGTISASDAARLIGRSGQWLRQLAKDGHITAVSRGRYDPFDVVHGYIEFLKDAERRSSKSSADNEVRQERAREIRLRNEEKTRQLIPIEDAIEAQDFLVGKVREGFAGLPARVTRDLKERRKIEAVCNAVQDEIAKAALAASDAARTGKPIPG